MNLIPAAGFPEREPVTLPELSWKASAEFGENLDKNLSPD
jgi:hypothetical protein